MTEPTEFDVVIVGAGFAGMYMLHRARGMGLKARVYDSAGGVGGTWYWNRYPGARCDIESMEYSYQFDDELQQEWEWTERYAAQPEILRYAEHVADRLGLRPDMQFNTRVLSATYGDDERWAIKLDTGEDLTTQFLIMATGCLSSANIPDFKGRDTFEGDTYHTGRWPHAPVDFTGKRVAVIGTGSSAIQSIPIIAEQASELYVFQRTAAYTVPARNGPIDQNYVEEVKADYAGFRARNSQMVTAFGSNVPLNDVSALAVSEDEREAKYWERWEHGGFFFLGAFNDLMLNADANATAGQFVRDRIREIVQDPEVAERLLPSTVIGCKRLCLDTHYYATYNRPNVELVDISEQPIDEITTTGIRVGDDHYDVDAIVYATGFDAMTGALFNVDIRGRDGLALRDAWHAGPVTYLGLGTAGFPNFFTITGPGSPSVLTNMFVAIEQHVNWISELLEYLRASGKRSVEATPEAVDAWVAHVNLIAQFTLYPSCNSWYLGANVPGKPRVFMPLVGFPPYAEKCAEVASNGYEGFALT